MKRVVLLLSLCLACNGASSKTTPPPTGDGDADGRTVPPIPAGYRAITPILVVTDVGAALDFYGAAFDARTLLTLTGGEGTVMHAELEIGDSRLMLASEEPDRDLLAPSSLGGSNGSLYMYVEDVDAAFERAVNAGAEPGMLPTDAMWGDRVAKLVDPAGHHWTLATHVQDVSPEQLIAGAEALGQALAAGEEPPEVVLEHTATNFKPAGFGDVTPALVVDSVDVLSFYKNAFAAKVMVELPMPDGTTLLHAKIRISDANVMLYSSLEAEGGLDTAAALDGNAVRLYHYVDWVDTTWKIAVDAGATPVSLPTEMLWGDRVGIVLDPVGNRWELATHVREVPVDELAKCFAAQAGN